MRSGKPLATGRMSTLIVDNEGDAGEKAHTPHTWGGNKRISGSVGHALKTLYVQEQGVTLQQCDGTIRITRKNDFLLDIPLQQVDTIVVFGTAHLTTPFLKLCLNENIGIHFLSRGGFYQGALIPGQGGERMLVKRQLQRTVDDTFCLHLSKNIVDAKIKNQMCLLARNRTGHQGIENTIGSLRQFTTLIDQARDIAALRGIEGRAQHCYFHGWRRLLRDRLGFYARNRRPPRDPVNSLLSYGYTLLISTITTHIRIAGLDPQFGFLHTTYRGRPSLACDLSEEFRALVIDSLLLFLFNSRVMGQSDFVTTPENAIHLTDGARRAFVHHFQQRLDTLVRPCDSGRSISFRHCIQRQVHRLTESLVHGDYQPFLKK